MTTPALSPATKARATERHKNVLYTMFALDMGKLLAPDRITPDMIHSAEWQERRKQFYEMFLPVLIRREAAADPAAMRKQKGE